MLTKENNTIEHPLSEGASVWFSELSLLLTSNLEKICLDTPILQMTKLNMNTAEPNTEVGTVLQSTIKIMLLFYVSCNFPLG